MSEKTGSNAKMFNGVSIKPQLLELESRQLLSGNAAWPLLMPNGGFDLSDVYGGFQLSDFLHFHEGIDVISLQNTPVTAIESGVVSAVDTTSKNPYREIDINSGTAAKSQGLVILSLGSGHQRRNWAGLQI